MLCLKRIGAEIHPVGSVLKAADFATILAAEELLARAHEEAAQIVLEAERTYDERKERGYREGLEQAKAEMAERVVATMDQSVQYVSQVEEALIDVVIKSTRRVIGDFEERDRVERVVRKALELLRHQSSVRIKVAPAQAEWLQTRVTALLTAFPRIQFLEVQSEPRLSADGCILETELGVIDATLETQLRAIEQALVKSIT